MALILHIAFLFATDNACLRLWLLHQVGSLHAIACLCISAAVDTSAYAPNMASIQYTVSDRAGELLSSDAAPQQVHAVCLHRAVHELNRVLFWLIWLCRSQKMLRCC